MAANYFKEYGRHLLNGVPANKLPQSLLNPENPHIFLDAESQFINKPARSNELDELAEADEPELFGAQSKRQTQKKKPALPVELTVPIETYHRSPCGSRTFSSHAAGRSTGFVLDWAMFTSPDRWEFF